MSGKRTPQRSQEPRGGVVGATQVSTDPETATANPRAIQQAKSSALELLLLFAIRANRLPEPEREYRFHDVRRFRLDFAWPDRMLAVEVEGGLYRGGGHTSVTGLKRDIEKSNLLTMTGWRLLRFHGDQVRSGEAVALIRQALEHVDPSPSAGREG